MGTKLVTHTFSVDLHGIVDLLSNHLYSDRGVFVHELLQNAVDAVSARQGIDPQTSPRFIRFSTPTSSA
jgi:molecular chaperone HtpG